MSYRHVAREERSAGPTGHAGVNVSAKKLEGCGRQDHKRLGPTGHCDWLAE